MSVDLLLDTHAVIWMVQGDERAAGLLPLMDDRASTVSISAATWLELAIKHSIGKLDVTVAAAREVARASNVLELSLSAAHAEQLEQLPTHHADPFDRMLIAQAMCEQMTIATIDPRFRAYDGLDVIWP